MRAADAEVAAAPEAEGADASWAIYQGGHSWKTWTPHISQMLMMASHDFAHPLGGASPTCATGAPGDGQPG